MSHLLAAAHLDIWVWNLNPGILLGLAVWTAGYILLTGSGRQRQGWGPPPGRGRQFLFHLGTLVAALALVTPLDYLSDEYLLSAHMVQHMLLILAAPPLWLVGIPPGLFDPLFAKGSLGRIAMCLTRPVPAFLIFNGILWAWHLPALYQAALFHENVHILEHLLFMAAAIIGWWPILGFLPRCAPRPGRITQLIYLLAMMASSQFLGAIFTLVHQPLYPYYLSAPLVDGARLWGISVIYDQYLAGQIMWMPSNALYLVIILFVLRKWGMAKSKS